MNKQLTVSIDKARPYKPVLVADQHSRGVVTEVAKIAEQAVNQAVKDGASLKDAKLRRIVEKHYGQVIADSLAGNALVELSRQCEKKPEPVTNNLQSDAPDLATYLATIEKKS